MERSILSKSWRCSQALRRGPRKALIPVFNSGHRLHEISTAAKVAVFYTVKSQSKTARLGLAFYELLLIIATSLLSKLKSVTDINIESVVTRIQRYCLL